MKKTIYNFQILKCTSAVMMCCANDPSGPVHGIKTKQGKRSVSGISKLANPQEMGYDYI